VWALQVASPELAALRKSYGLSPLPNGDHPFHITVAVRRTNVLKPNEVSKFDISGHETSRGELKAAAAKNETTYECGCSGPCTCPPSCTCRQRGCAARAKAATTKDVLTGGSADNMPDSKFNPETLAEGKKHEHEHTDSDQVAKEIAKDHLQEDAAYYEKIKKVEKSAKSVYLNQLQRALDPTVVRGPIVYDPNKPVFENVRNQLGALKQRGDRTLEAQRNQRIWRAQVDPNYRYQLFMDAVHGRTPQPALIDQAIERYGDGVLPDFSGSKK
jgi:hypothetical protein